jgi:hypothetical protein
MNATIARLKGQLARPANILEVDPNSSLSPYSSFLGSVKVALPGEAWPMYNGLPMFPIAQLNLRGLHWLPAALQDIELITVFFAEPVLAEEGENGGAWVLRAYDKVASLSPVDVDLSTLHEEYHAVNWRPSAARCVLLADDLPDAYDLPADVQYDEPLVDEWSSNVSPYESSKIGGWPYLLQGPLEWPVPVDAVPEFALQLSGFDADMFPFQDIIYYIARARGSATPNGC